jgi:hypothetical protein
MVCHRHLYRPLLSANVVDDREHPRAALLVAGPKRQLLSKEAQAPPEDAALDGRGHIAAVLTACVEQLPFPVESLRNDVLVAQVIGGPAIDALAHLDRKLRLDLLYHGAPP